jgi:hypothetical protein
VNNEHKRFNVNQPREDRAACTALNERTGGRAAARQARVR